MVPRTDKGRRVQQRIYADRPQCVAVVGDPRIGKTGFLEWLLASVEANDPAPPPGTYFVQMSLRDPDLATPEAFLRTAVERLERRFPDPAGARGSVPPGPDGAPKAYDLFEAAVQRVAESGGRYILLLDDFDRVTQSNTFPLQFFSFLRSNANNFPVAYVTTSRLDLQQLCALKEVEESPFFNIFQNVSLGPMDEKIARLLVVERLGDGEGPAAEWALAQSGGLPAVLTAACDVASRGIPPGTEAADAALDVEAAPYFAELWDHFEAHHRDLIERIARGEPTGPRDTKPLRELGPRRGYLHERDGAWTTVSPAFGRFVAGVLGGTSAPGLFTKVRRFFGGGGRP